MKPPEAKLGPGLIFELISLLVQFFFLVSTSLVRWPSIWISVSRVCLFEGGLLFRYDFIKGPGRRLHGDGGLVQPPMKIRGKPRK